MKSNQFWFSIGGSAPFLSGYTSRKKIVINNQGNPVALTGHQIAITMTASQSDVFTASMTNGEDIRFTTSNGVTLLNHWISSYNKAGNSATIYVKVTNVSAFSNGTIYMYYNKPGSTTASSWANTMQRIELSPSGGDTKYLVRCDEGSGTSLSNIGSAGGSLSIGGTAPTWDTTNAYGQAGTGPNLNGTNNVILIPTLLDTWPTKGEISLSFKAITLPTAGAQWALFEKYNRVGAGFPDLGDMLAVYLQEVSGSVYVRIQVRKSSQVSPANFTNYAAFVANDINLTNITAGSSHKVSVVWNESAIGFYVDGLFAGRSRFYHADGHGTDFTIGAVRSSTTGAIGLYSNIEINDFRYTDYTSGQYPKLPQIEAEHIQTRFIQKDARTKMAVNNYLIATNIHARNGRLISAADASNPQYNTPLLEPVILYDVDDSKYKIWYNDLFHQSGLGQIYYREASTLAGLASATDVIVTKSGTTYPQRLTIYKENGVFHLFYSNRIQAGVNALTPIYHQTSNDGKNFSNETTALTVPVSGFGSNKGFENTGAIQKIGSTYYMLVEAYTGSSNETGLATSSNVAGPYTIVGPSSPLTSIEYTTIANNGGGPGSRPILYNGDYYFIYHSQWSNPQVGQTVYDETFFAKTPDFSTFTKINAGGPSNVAGRAFDDPFATDQFADPDWTTDGNKLQFAWNAVQNQNAPNFFGTVEVSEFDGNLAQLLTDLTITIQ